MQDFKYVEKRIGGSRLDQIINYAVGDVPDSVQENFKESDLPKPHEEVNESPPVEKVEDDFYESSGETGKLKNGEIIVISVIGFLILLFFIVFGVVFGRRRYQRTGQFWPFHYHRVQP